VAKGDAPRHGASQQFFEKLGLLTLLNESERHGLISNAVTRLWGVHQAMDNFYNEPPFAERLKSISEQGAIPETIQEEYVAVVVGCRIGNGYGYSRAAVPFYDGMIRGFSPREISLMVNLPKSNGIVGRRINIDGGCRKNFIDALKLIDRASVPKASLTDFDAMVKAV